MNRATVVGSLDFLRQDQRDRFVLVKRPDVTVVWGYAPTSYLYHATIDGLRSFCRSTILLDDTDAPVSCYDRSDDTMTCQRCLDFVRRIPEDLKARRDRAFAIAEKRAVERRLMTRAPPACSSGKVLR